MKDQNLPSKQRRSRAIVGSLIVAIVAVLIVTQALFAANANASANASAGKTAVAQGQGGDVITTTIQPLDAEADDALGEYLRAHTTYDSANGLNAGTAVADLSGSTKSVNLEEAQAGATLNYTIVISNSETGVVTGIVMTDILPAELSYKAGTFDFPTSVTTDYSDESDIISTGVITWSGVVLSKGTVTLSFSADLTDTLAVDDIVTNTVMIDSAGTVISRSASTTIVAEPATRYNFLPIIYKPFPDLVAPTVQVSRPNSQNKWTLTWGDTNTNVAGFEIQESHDPDFGVILETRNTAANVNATEFVRALSINNEYFYRVRTLSAVGVMPSAWSAPVSVIGGYYDDFSNWNSGWAIRRTTYLEEVRSWYERNGNEDWFILQVEDSWDWGIAAPYKTKAPTVPYAIEYRSKIAHTANLVSHGAVFGADWPGGTCPDYSSLDGLYRHNICFNHFYNTNTIWYGNDLKLLFERVDYLEWRPQDGGSPMKRGSFDNYASWFEVNKIPNTNASDWNTYRIEVRSDGIRLFANGQQYAYTADTQWINEPYFGVFASTDEYSNSTWRFDYYKVTPLD